MLKTIMIRSALLAIACALSVAAHAYASDPKRFDVPPGDLTAALEMLARQSGMELVYQSEQLKGLSTKGVTGTFTPEEAVTKLLEDTPLTFRKDPSGAMLIAPPRSSLSPLGEKEAPAAREGGAFLAPGTAAASGSSTEKKGWFERFRLAQNDQDPASSSSSKDEQDNQNPTKDSDEQMGEVIVTAQKRAERLQDVPISISVLGGDALDRSTVQGLTEELNRVPGLSTTVIRGFGSARVTVRGVGSTGFTFTGGNAVAYYVDSVPFGFVRSAIVPDSNSYDLERVEVLRGPQGTLYGASALNGVVRVLTKDANLREFEAKARGSASSTDYGGEGYRADLAVNVPIVEDKLAVRAVVGYQELDGWIDKPIREDANDAEISNFRFKVNAQPTDQLSIGLFAWLSRTDTGAYAASPDGRQSASVLEEPNSIDYDAYGVKLGYDFSGFSISSMTSYLDYGTDGVFDFAPFGIPDTLLTTRLESEVFSEEILLNSNHEGPWRWSFGGIYRDTDERLFQFRRQNVAPTDQTTASKSFAVFGEATRSFLDGRFELTGGLRYFEDEISDREHSRTNGAPAAQLISTDSKFDSVTPRVVLTWHPGDQMTVYTSYAEGFRSGLNQAPPVRVAAPQFPPADPDELKNYELGAKGSLWDGRVSFDTAVFYIDWQGVQQALAVEVAPTVLNTALVNAGSASGVGFEFAVTGEPVDGLTFGVNLSWNDLTVDQDTFSSGILLFPEGSRLNFSPETTAGASAGYAFPLGGGGFEGRFSAYANYVSEQDNRQILGGVVRVGAGDPMLIAGTSFSIESPRHWTASIFVDNINNENGIPMVDNFSPQWNARVRPRTIGAQLEYHF